MIRTCYGCRYYDDSSRAAQQGGFCRRRCPQAIVLTPAGLLRGVQPIVDADGWCGEQEPVKYPRPVSGLGEVDGG